MSGLASFWRRGAAAVGSLAPSWVRHSATLVVIYVAAMSVLTLWMPVWHDLDVKFFQWVSAPHTLSLSPDITLVDDRSVDKPSNHRLTLALFLDRLAASKQRPQAVILDYDFRPCLSTCGESMASINAAFVRGLQAAATAGINVYASVIVPVDKYDNVTGPLDPEDPGIYAHLAGTGDNIFNITPDRFAYYRGCYRPGNGLAEDVWAMVLRVLPEFDRISSHGCDTEHTGHSPVLGGASRPEIPKNYAITNASPFPKSATFSKYVIVGTLQYDRPSGSDISGPELVARALSGELQRSQSGYYTARPQGRALLLLVPAVSGITVLAFAACFFLVRRLRLRGARRFLPWLSAGLAVGVGLAVFVAFEWLMFFNRQIQPQVTLVSFSVLLSAVLCGVRGKQIAFEDEMDIGVTGVEKYDYDVFISYAHDERAWVFEHLYVPLRDARLPDGRKLSIFFDTSTIRVGTAWQDKISLAIDESRFIVPVYSEGYFQRPYCRFEIRRAHRKWVGAGEQSRCVLPIMRGHIKVPSVVDDIQAVSVDDQTDLVQTIIAEIVERLSQQPPLAGIP